MAGAMKRSIAMVVAAQLVVLLSGVAKGLLIPHFLNVDSFAFWQVYVLYSGFVGVFTLGFCDGIYLKFGGHEYGDLPFDRLRGAFRVYFLVLAMFSAAASLSSMLVVDSDQRFALAFAGADILAVGVSGLFLYVLQITNRIRAYSFFSIIDKVAMLSCVVAIVWWRVPDFRCFVVADCATKYLVSIFLAFKCRRLLCGSTSNLGTAVKDFVREIQTGFSLLVANLAGMLAVNIGRFIVEWWGDRQEYAFYSFGISITNLVLTFVNAVALVLYPTLKRLDVGRSKLFFDKTNYFVLKVSVLALVIYGPARAFVESMFPQYSPILSYLNLLFLAVVGQVKMQLLNNTYYKALRLEKSLLMVNLQSVLVSAAVGYLAFLRTSSVWWIAATTAAVLLGRAWLSEIDLRKRLGIDERNQIVFEVAACGSFLAATSFLHGVALLVGATLISVAGLFGVVVLERLEVGRRAIK